MELGPFGGEVQGDLGVVVGDHLAGRHVDHGGHGDPARVIREAGQVGVAQPVDAEHRIDLARIEIKGPAQLVMGGPAQPERDDLLQPEQAAHDEGAVGPGAGAGGDQPVPIRRHRVAVSAVRGDPGGDVVGVALELARLDVAACLRFRLGHTDSLADPGRGEGFTLAE